MSSIETGGQSAADTSSVAVVASPSAAEVVPPDTRIEPLAKRQRDLAAEDRQRHARRNARRWGFLASHWMATRVPHPDGGEHSVEEILHDEAEQRAKIETERAQGSKKHDRLPGWLHQIPKVVLLGDLSLLVYFFAGITDVDWSSPISAGLLFAVLLAIVVTILAYGVFSFTGHRLRSFKDHAGAVHAADLDGFTKMTVACSAVGIGIIAALMFIRMRTEVLYALGPTAGFTALAVALALAAVSALANFLVIGIHAHDGSYDVDRLNKLSSAARRTVARAHRARRRAAAGLDR